MGISLYCICKKDNTERIAKTDLNIKNIENNEIYKRDSTSIMISNNRTSIDSPLIEKRDIFINPIPEIVTIKPKKPKKRKIISNYHN